MSIQSNSPSLSRAIFLWIGAIVVAAVAGGVLTLHSSSAPDIQSTLLWGSFFLIGEALRFRTPTGKGSVSMVEVVHMAGLLVLDAPTLLVAVWGSRLVTTLVFQRQVWYRALFNTAQISLAVLAASDVYRLFGGTVPMPMESATAAQNLGAIFAASAAYYFVNILLVSHVIGLATKTSPFVVWKNNFGYRIEIVNTVALFLLAPIAAITHQTVGPVGLIVFILPLLFIRDACERFIVLEKTQHALISSERLAAKGEMAAAVGHELNNFLGVMTGNLQLFRRNAAKVVSGRDLNKLDVLEDQVRRMTALSRGLMDFAKIETRTAPTSIETLVKETVAFLSPQNRLDGIEIVTRIEPGLKWVNVDSGQIQQVFMNLLNNSADAFREAGVASPRIEVRVGEANDGKWIETVVVDNGPGIPLEQRKNIFEPSFTTKETGHGFGLSTVYRIVSNHGGSIHVDEGPDGGALFRILLPVSGQEQRDRAA